MKIINAIGRAFAIVLMVIVTLAFILSLKPANAATIDGLVWMDSPCEGCIAVVKDLEEGSMRVIYMEKNGDYLLIISIKKLHCITKTKKQYSKSVDKLEYCDYKIITEYEKPQTQTE